MDRHLRLVSKRFNALVTELLYQTWTPGARLSQILDDSADQSNDQSDRYLPIELKRAMDMVNRYTQLVTIPCGLEHWSRILSMMSFQRLGVIM